MTVREIDVDELERLLASGVELIDVREPDEYEDARVPGARLVPLATVPDELDNLPTDTTLYLVCASGGRSMRAAEFLIERGLDAVNVAGGTKGWQAAGKAVASGPATA